MGTAWNERCRDGRPNGQGGDHVHDHDHEYDDRGEEIVELWWCPVCSAAAHRTRRPGRPKVYCSNACRQRAYRWRRDHHARTIAPPFHPAPSAFVAFGRWHALRTPRDFVGRQADRRSRRPTVCGVLARPARKQLSRRLHYNFVASSPEACRRCAELVAPPLDPLTTVEIESGAGLRRPHQPFSMQGFVADVLLMARRGYASAGELRPPPPPDG